ncbi:hypothetical protein [Paenibacillus koleovorans]|uniref:hypothetical protein n=1 Tax=Paenibacillus koleovorans TaxID=121608 RepID=UPI0013E35CB6|nr:hypothetical protein [Paenibacillus koleovorans]
MVAFLLLTGGLLVVFGGLAYLLYLGLQKDTVDLDFQTVWKGTTMTRKDMEFES